MLSRKEQKKRDKFNAYRRRRYRRMNEEKKKAAWIAKQEQWRIAREAKAKRKAEREAKRAAKAEAKRLRDEKKKQLPKRTQEFLNGWQAALDFVRGGGLAHEGIVNAKGTAPGV
jgi:hypothetical protein